MRYFKYSLIPLGMFWAYYHSWLSDDIFITFRYVQQLFNGNGLVYNVGEYVEGFTHPLWLIMLIPFYPNLELASQILGLLSFGGLIYLLTRSGWLAAGLVVFNMEMRIWATGGLETMFFTFLVFLSVWATLEKKNWVGWVLLAMILTRPDGILIAGVILLFNWRYYKPLLLLIPFLALRYFYYGDLLPNPYYAKSGGGSYFSQGFYYIWVYVSVYVSTFLILYGFRFIKKKEIALPMAVIFVYLILFVARVGGDFMYARFIIPVIPLIYFIIEQSFKEFKSVAILVSILVLFSLVEFNLRTNLFYDKADNHKPAFELRGVTDESWYWGQKVNGMTPIDANRVAGQNLKKIFNGKRFCVLLRGQASLGYYGEFYTCIENAGLTDRFIAKQNLGERGRVGHEKGASLEYMKQRGVHFVFNRTTYDASNKQVLFTLSGIRLRAEIITLDSLVKSIL